MRLALIKQMPLRRMQVQLQQQIFRPVVHPEPVINQ